MSYHMIDALQNYIILGASDSIGFDENSLYCQKAEILKTATLQYGGAAIIFGLSIRSYFHSFASYNSKNIMVFFY